MGVESERVVYCGGIGEGWIACACAGIGGSVLGRDCGGRGAQRAGVRGLSGAGGAARAGDREPRARVGGACTIEEPFPAGVRMSPCAYLAGLLHPLVVEELGCREADFTGRRR